MNATSLTRLTRGLPLAAWLLLLLALAAPPARAHIGSPNVFYEGLAGPYHVRVTVRPPPVVPGLAAISVRVVTGEVARVTVLPVRSDTGTKGAPPPDEARPVAGEPGLYSAELWLMKSGAFSIFVHVTGPAGEGTTVVPVNAIATRRLEMAPWLGWFLAAFALALVIGLVMLVGVAVRDSVLEAGADATPRQRWRARIAMGIATVIVATALWGGRSWWNREDSNYRNNRLYQPDRLTVVVGESDGRPQLRLERQRSQWGQRPLVPEHGKLMHLFLVRTGDMAGFAHLHPVSVRSNRFTSFLPPLPAGRYSVYADVTHESGFTQTLTNEVELAAGRGAEAGDTRLTDPDDSFLAAGPAPVGGTNCPLDGGLQLVWLRPAGITAGRETMLRFRVVQADGRPAVLEPYMSMQAHAAVRRDDGAVFTHLHPFGTISMTAQELFVKRERTVAPGKRTLEVTCGLPASDDEIRFPYEFPLPGRYAVWVQVKSGGRIHTGRFLVEVAADGL